MEVGRPALQKSLSETLNEKTLPSRDADGETRCRACVRKSTQFGSGEEKPIINPAEIPSKNM